MFGFCVKYMWQPQIETVLLFYVCSAQSENLHNLEITLCVLKIPRFGSNLERYADNIQTICGWYAEVRRQYVGGIQRYADNVWVVYRSMQTICGWYIASFPGPAQLSVACSTEKQGRAWYIFSCE